MSSLNGPASIPGFSFDPLSGQYSGMVEIVRQDFDGSYPLPANTVLFAPMTTPGPQQALRINAEKSAWELVADFRNQRLFAKTSGQPVANHLALGEAVPDDLTLIAPPDSSGQWTFNADAHYWQRLPQPEPDIPEAKNLSDLDKNEADDDEEMLGARHITNLAFDLRFSMQERVAMELAALDNPSDPIEKRTQAATLRVVLERSRKAEYTDLDDPTTRSGVEHMEALRLLAQGRAAEILDAEIQMQERF